MQLRKQHAALWEPPGRAEDQPGGVVDAEESGAQEKGAFCSANPSRGPALEGSRFGEGVRQRPMWSEAATMAAGVREAQSVCPAGQRAGHLWISPDAPGGWVLGCRSTAGSRASLPGTEPRLCPCDLSVPPWTGSFTSLRLGSSNCMYQKVIGSTYLEVFVTSPCVPSSILSEDVC